MVIKKFNHFERNNRFSMEVGVVLNRCLHREVGQTLTMFKTEQIFSRTVYPKIIPCLRLEWGKDELFLILIH